MKAAKERVQAAKERVQGFPDGSMVKNGSTVKNLPANAGDTGDANKPLGWVDLLEEEMATHFQYSYLENPKQRSLAGYSS